MVDPELMRNGRAVFRDALALYVGRGRRHSVEVFADATGLSRDQLGRWLRAETEPRVSELMVVVDHLGPEFANELLRGAGMGGARRLDADELQAFDTLAELATGTASMAEALKDGRLDHRERAELAPQMAALGTHLIGAAAAMKGGRS